MRHEPTARQRDTPPLPEQTEAATPVVDERARRALLTSPRFLLFFGAATTYNLSIFLLQAALPKYLSERGFSNTAVGLVIGIFSVSAVLPRPLLGMTMDRGGLVALLIGGAAAMLTSPLYGVGTALALLIAVRLVQGVSSAILITGGPILAADLVTPARRGEAVGYFSIAGTVAIATGSPAGLLIGEHLAYPVTFALSAAAGLVSVLLLLPFRRDAAMPSVPTRVRGALFESRIMPALIPSFVTGLGNGALFTFIVQLMDARHLPGAGFFFTMDAVMFFTMRAIGGRWSDRYGRWRVIIPSLVALGTSLAILTAFPVFPAFVVAALIWGGGICFAIPELNALAIDLVPPERRGAAVATQTGVFDLGIAVSGIALGWLADRTSLPFIFGLVAVLFFATALGSGLRNRAALRSGRAATPLP